MLFTNTRRRLAVKMFDTARKRCIFKTTRKCWK